MSIIQFYRIVLQFSEALFYVLNTNFKFKMLTRAPAACKNILSVSDDNKTCGFPYHIIDQNKQQKMWVVASPGLTGICRVNCKNRVKFDPAADLRDPAVGKVLA